MTTEPQAQTSERERLIDDLGIARDRARKMSDMGACARAIDMIRADAEKIRALEVELQKWREGTSAQRAEDVRTIRALEAALVVLAEIPIEAFGKESRPEYPLMGWDGHLLKVEHVLAARAALTLTQSPRSEAGEGVK